MLSESIKKEEEKNVLNNGVLNEFIRDYKHTEENKELIITSLLRLQF